MDFCSFILSGRIGKTPQLRATKDGKKYAYMSVANDRSFKNQDGTWTNITDWYSVFLSGAVAEHYSQKALPGDTVIMQGRLSTRKKKFEGHPHDVDIISLTAEKIKRIPKSEQQKKEGEIVQMKQESAFDEELPF